MKISGRAHLTNTTMKMSQIVWVTPANLGTFDTSGSSSGVAVAVTLIATGATSYAIVAGALPVGLTLAPTGEITGSTGVISTATFTVRASRGALGADRVFSMTIVNTAGGQLAN